ncbi:hypothetical protein TraAM80_04682 [Trypanosoma rangeli]|uniref:G5-interacting protein n=1 Tax=Trypanosoma rangeli TaxID=5698 RepID=A0A422NI97_TRYRA|nr:uncharacterized protein TraAM80_04682 [Trypanosoma rangeli]RNF05208.1 hypothetical protein TraAM80_04682 [Trypanosoma rangeli]|eukprot:RNF05208.1 hypothetical protein TraAM80_04682 [Trypanosoma rangeli]
MSLNPNAAPWSVPESGVEPGMDANTRMGQQGSRFHGYHLSYYTNQHTHQMVPQQMSRHIMGPPFPNTNHMPPMPSNEPAQPYNNPRLRPQHYNANAVHSMQHVSVPSYKKSRPVVVVVFGYRRVGKTSVAKRISEVRNYKYISLKSKEEGVVVSPTDYVAPLADLLARKNTFEGIVIDDIVVRNKFEPYYVHFLLQKHGLKFDVVVVLDNDLDNTKLRGVNYDDPLQRQLHPESYEFCASYLEGEPTLVVECREKTLDEVVGDALRQLGDVNPAKESTISLKEVELMLKCPLETDPTLVAAILEAQTQQLNLDEAASFPFSEPNFLLEYAVFARHAYALRSYMITPWIQGDKVSLIGYQGKVYIHLPSYNIVFRFTDAPAALTQLNKGAVDNNGIGFIFEATFVRDKIYISDLLMMGEQKGSDMLAGERVELLRLKLKDMDSSGTVDLLPWYPVKSMEACESENPEASGVLFVNPDGVLFGRYDSRNFLYPLQRKKSVELRIWNGNFAGDTWTFDAFCEEVESEKVIEGVPVHVPDTEVTTHCINDGNILECVRQDYHHAGPNKTRRGAKRFVFQGRCQWKVQPTTMYRQEVFVSDAKWPFERMSQACMSIKHVPAVRPEEPATADR